MKKRLDVLLVELGYFDSREKAKREIMVGNVIINDKAETKPGSQFKEENIKDIRIKNKLKYVSRGGLKLEKAINYWNLDFNDKKILDIGASTGGFTDCALQYGAKLVYANDVGTNQLDYTLKNNEKVISLEQIHIRDLIIDDKVDYFENFGKDNFGVIALIKPQFELTPDKISRNGIVIEEKYHDEAIKKVVHSFIDSGYIVKEVIDSPIKGTKGNKEFLIYVIKGDKNENK